MNETADILIVDDTESSRKLMRVVLEQSGFTVSEAPDGLEALELLTRRPVQLVLADVLMPRMDGYRLCYEIRTRPPWANIGVILYTGSYNSPADQRLAFQFGADKYLKKPIGNAELVEVVREVLQRAPRGQSSELSGPAELVVMKEYNEVLVTKLEAKNAALEQARTELLHSNEDLRARTLELERAREALRRANEDLEHRVRVRTAELEAANRELESFSHSVSHDLRAPIRAIEGWTAILLGQCAERLDDECRELLGRIPAATSRMKALIEDLLELSQVTRAELRRVPVDLSALAQLVFEELRQAEPDRRVEFVVAPGFVSQGDPALLRIALENLLSNALKFTRNRPEARIEFGRCSHNNTGFVRDNGVGFEMAKAGRLFEPFHRLHPPSQFPGTGIGLATVRRIMERHGGRVWAESVPNEHTTFFFSAGGEQPGGLPSRCLEPC